MVTENYKEWADMTEAEQAYERSLPKDERQWRALKRGLARKPVPSGRLVKSRRGTWGRILVTGCRKGCVAALTASECETIGLVAGRGNI